MSLKQINNEESGSWGKLIRGKMKLLLLALVVVYAKAQDDHGIDFCDKRFLQHYKAKDCTGVIESDPNCPSRYECPKPGDDNKNGCNYRGHLYKQGESVPVLNPCQICSCRKNNRKGSGYKIDCIGIECPSVFRPPLNSSCYEVYEEGQCCSSRTECSTGDGNSQEKVCKYNGRTYHLGEKIYSDEDPCRICSCTKDYTDINGRGCYLYNCDLQKRKDALQKGTLPIYHQGTCCPIQYYNDRPVPHDHEQPSQEDIDSGNTCEYKGEHYKRGDYLDIGDKCVTCKCVTPPDFTCVQQSCNPQTPAGVDPDTCHLTRPAEGKCCPSYICPGAPPQKGTDIVRTIKASCIRWLGHLSRKLDADPAKKVTFSRIEGTRRRGRPPTRWVDDVERDLKTLGVNRWRAVAPDRVRWRGVCESALACKRLLCS